jgi:hypothetical protein
MRQVSAVLTIMFVLAACSVGVWVSTGPPLAPFLASGASSVAVTVLGWNEWQITYRVPGAPSSWFTEVAEQLERQHWSSPDHVGYGSLTRSYSRALPLGVCEL